MSDLMNFKKTIFFIFIFVFPSFLYHSYSQNAQSIQDSLRAVELYRQAVEYGRNFDPEKSLEYFQQSLEHRKRIYGEKHFRMGGTYMGIAIQYKNLYQFENAFKNYRLAEEMFLFNAPENDSRLGDIYTNIGIFFQLKGDYSEAIRYNERAISIYENTKDIFDKRNYMSAIYNLANALHQANNHEESLSIILKYQDLATDYYAYEYKNLLASIYSATNRPIKAKEILKSLVHSLIVEYGEDDIDLANQYTAYGQFFIYISQTDSGLAYLEKAERIYSLYGNTQQDMGEVYLAMANAWSEKTVNSSSVSEFQSIKSRNINNAIGFYIKGLKILNGKVNIEKLSFSDFEGSNFSVLNLRLLNQLGRSWHQLAYIQQDQNQQRTKEYLSLALNAYTTASDLAMQMRTSFISEESKILFAELQRYIFSYAISASYELFQLTGQATYFNMAFENAGRAKAASLFDNVAEMQARENSLIPDSLLEQESRYNSNLAYYRERLFDETHSTSPDSSKIAEFQQQIFRNEQRRTDLMASLESNFSEYYELKYKRRQLTIQDIQRSLKRNETLVEFVVNIEDTSADSGSLYVFTISKENYQLRKEPFTSDTKNNIEILQRTLSTTQFLNSGLEQFKSYCDASFSLYNKLLQPSIEIIRDKRLTIIPDGILSYIPFEALLTQKVGTNHIHYHDLPYLILNYPVNYAYSSELYLRGSNKPSFRRRQTIAFAPDYKNAHYSDVSIPQLASIPGIFEEVKYLKEKIGAISFKGDEATEGHFRKYAGEYDILHLAMHTLINDSVPLYSRLAFFPGDDDDLHDDGWLNTSDIYNLNLKARMAVLSACNTGSGILRRGEGVMSLARGFFYAGCPSVVMTLWEVEDRSGTAIMKEFYRNLKSGKSKDIALRNAKLKHIQNADPLMSHPHFWLGYITIGQTEPLFSGNEIYFFGTLILIAFLLIADHFRKKLIRARRTSQF
jgi:CHAT domain-containing protein